MSEQITGIENDYGVLRDVLLGKPTHFRWTDAGPENVEIVDYH